MTHEEPRILFLHYWGVGRTEDLARGLRRALDETRHGRPLPSDGDERSHASGAPRSTSSGSGPSASADRSRSSATCSATSWRRRRWITEADYREGLALAQLAPGPLAAQLAIYLGWARGGALGAALVAIAFVLPSFVMVLALSAAYLRFGGLSWMQGAFYGIGGGGHRRSSRGAPRSSPG